MPLQTLFYDRVSSVTTVRKYPLGTLRYEGNKVYKYVVAGGTIAALYGCSASASGTVVARTTSLVAIGVNSTGASRASGDYFWMQVSGEIGDATVGYPDTNSATAVGYPAYTTDASGVLTGTAASGTAIGTSTVVVKSASVGIVLLAGLL